MYQSPKNVGEFDMANTKYKQLEHERNDRLAFTKNNAMLKTRYMASTTRLKTSSPYVMGRKEDM